MVLYLFMHAPLPPLTPSHHPLVSTLQAVSAEGSSLVDLLDNYMKNCTDKKIVPFGGQLHLVYDEAWNPPGQHFVHVSVHMDRV